MNRPEIAQRLTDAGLVAIIRADSSEGLLEAAAALLAGGVTVMEVTMTTPHALEIIAAIRRHFGEALLVGVGTVIDAPAVSAAVQAGAEFIVTPVTKPEVIAASHHVGKPILSGALTPTECLFAHENGADFVKLFPADLGGPAYIKNLLAPLPMLRIVPTGGVTPQTADAFFQAGCVALGAGSTLVSREILREHDWPKLTQRARDFVEAVAKSRAGP